MLYPFFYMKWNKKGKFLLLSLSSLFHLPTFFLSYISFCVYILCLSIQGNEIGKEFFIINVDVVVTCALYCVFFFSFFFHSFNLFLRWNTDRKSSRDFNEVYEKSFSFFHTIHPMVLKEIFLDVKWIYC